MKKELIKDLIVFISSFILYYFFGTGIIYLLLKLIYNINGSSCLDYLNDPNYRERGLSNIAQLISTVLIILLLVLFYFKKLKASLAFFKDYKIVFKTLGYGLLVYFVTVCYNLFLPFAGGSGEDGSNVNMIKASMENQYWIMLVLVVFLGPIIEELIFRFIPFNSFKNVLSKTSLIIISTILFTLPHMFSLFNSGDILGDLLALPKYLIVGGMLANYYYKNKDIGRVILVHIMYNIISFTLMSVVLFIL